MKKLIQILIVCGLFLVLGGTASGDENFDNAVKAYQSQDYKEAVRLYRLSAEQGDAFGQYNLGIMYSNGQGVPKHDKEAVKWYRLSAEQGFAKAQYNLGVMYFNGTGVLQDYKEAVRLQIQF
jgi:uncharacterized protein